MFGQVSEYLAESIENLFEDSVLLRTCVSCGGIRISASAHVTASCRGVIVSLVDRGDLHMNTVTTTACVGELSRVRALIAGSCLSPFGLGTCLCVCVSVFSHVCSSALSLSPSSSVASGSPARRIERTEEIGRLATQHRLCTLCKGALNHGVQRVWGRH